MFDDTITAILERDDHQLSRREYRYIADLLASRGGCNFLVFGVGHDSQLWLQANRMGRTVFLESSFFWSQQIKWQHPDIDVRGVSYRTRRQHWRDLLEGPVEKLRLELPGDVDATRWDVIFVDGPAGYNDSCPGRMKSIYTAAALGARSRKAHVLVHDCNRQVERRFCDAFLGKSNLVRGFDRTRHYRLSSDAK